MSSTKNIGPGSMSEEETELTESQPAQKRRRIAARELPAEHTSNLDPNVANTPKRGARRSLPCECCIRAAILSEGDLGYCYESSWPSRKCYACVMSGHQCHPCHNALKPYARRMIMALDNDENTMYDRCRQTLCLAFTLLAEPESVFDDMGDICSADGPAVLETAEQRRERGKRLIKGASELIKEGLDLL